MADTENDERPISPPTHALVEVTHPQKGKVLSHSGTSANLTRNTRVVSDRIIFVDNIADSISQEEFVGMMGEYALRGPVVDIKFLTRTKGSSFAFVEFSSEQDGKAAILALNKKRFYHQLWQSSRASRFQSGESNGNSVEQKPLCERSSKTLVK